MKDRSEIVWSFLFGVLILLPLISRFFMDYEGENEYIFATAAVTFLLALILPGVVAFIFGRVSGSKYRSFSMGLIPYLVLIIILWSDFPYGSLLNYLFLGLLSGLSGIVGCLKVPTERKFLKLSIKLFLFFLFTIILVMCVFLLLTNETHYANDEYIGTYPLIPGFKGVLVVENYPKAYGGFADHIPRRMVFMNVKDDGTIILEEAKVGNPISLVLGTPLNPRNARFSTEMKLNPKESVSKGDLKIRYCGSDEFVSISEVKPFIKLNLYSEEHYGELRITHFSHAPHKISHTFKKHHSRFTSLHRVSPNFSNQH
ncbi:MAG: hypothetical protein SVY15_09360, partial [Halobacteriota archaeon]|nr:hypothetical protein [Halobacteriota archaeon]